MGCHPRVYAVRVLLNGLDRYASIAGLDEPFRGTARPLFDAILVCAAEVCDVAAFAGELVHLVVELLHVGVAWLVRLPRLRRCGSRRLPPS